MLSPAGGERRLPDSLFGAVLIGGFIVMLLLDQLHTVIARGKSFQTSPPPTNNDPEDPWKVQVAKDGPPKKHVWVSTTSKTTPAHVMSWIPHAQQAILYVCQADSLCCLLGIYIAYAVFCRRGQGQIQQRGLLLGFWYILLQVSYSLTLLNIL